MDELKNIARGNLEKFKNKDVDGSCPFLDASYDSPYPEDCQIYCGRVFEEWRVRREREPFIWMCPCDFYPSLTFVEVRFWAWLNS